MAAFVAPILTGISGLAGLFGGGTQQTQKVNNTTTSNNQSSTTPNLSPIQQALINQFSNQAENLANQGTNLQPYEASGLQQIGSTEQSNQANISNTLAAKGLQYSPAAGNAYTQNVINAGNQQSQFLNQIPLLQRQIQQQNIAGLESAFQVQPTATSSTQSGTSNTQGTQTTSGNPIAGALGGVGAGLAASYPSLISSFGGSSGTSLPSFNPSPSALYPSTVLPESDGTGQDLGAYGSSGLATLFGGNG